jgi:hypothetical protein
MYRVTRTIIPEDELMWNSPRFLIAIVGFALWVSVGSVSAAPQELTVAQVRTQPEPEEESVERIREQQRAEQRIEERSRQAGDVGDAAEERVEERNELRQESESEPRDRDRAQAEERSRERAAQGKPEWAGEEGQGQEISEQMRRQREESAEIKEQYREEGEKHSGKKPWQRDYDADPDSQGRAGKDPDRKSPGGDGQKGKGKN